MANTVTERSSARYTATLLDENGAAVALVVMTSLKLWLRDVATEEYINGREAQDVLNANNMTFHATSGLLTWLVQPADNAILSGDSGIETETHEAIFEAKWSSTKQKTWKVTITVTNMFSLV